MSRSMRYSRAKSLPPQTLLDYLCERFGYLDEGKWTEYIAAGMVSIKRNSTSANTTSSVGNGGNQTQQQKQQLRLERREGESKRDLNKRLAAAQEASAVEISPLLPTTLLQQQDLIRFDPPQNLEPEVDKKYEIVFEDSSVIVVLKSGNIPVSAGGRYSKNTLRYILSVDLAERGGTRKSEEQVTPEIALSSSSSSSSSSLYVVHRLDKETSGLVVFAKTLTAAHNLSAQFQSKSSSSTSKAVDRQECEKEVEREEEEAGGGNDSSSPGLTKEYQALLQGEMDLTRGSVKVEARIGFATEGMGKSENTDENKNNLSSTCGGSVGSGGDGESTTAQLAKLRMACFPPSATHLGKSAKTVIYPMAVGNGLTFARVELFTGRTHQIRLHCAEIGHPVLGDKLYVPKGHPEVSEAQYLRRARGQEDMICHLISKERERTVEMQGNASDVNDGLVATKKSFHVPRHLLHAFKLSFIHPETEQRMTFERPAESIFGAECPMLLTETSLLSPPPH